MRSGSRLTPGRGESFEKTMLPPHRRVRARKMVGVFLQAVDTLPEGATSLVGEGEEGVGGLEEADDGLGELGQFLAVGIGRGRRIGPELRRLIEEGADLNAISGFGQTPLHIAAAQGHADIAATLIRKGAKVEALDSMMHTPKYWAKRGHHRLVVQVLEKFGARD